MIPIPKIIDVISDG